MCVVATAIVCLSTYMYSRTHYEEFGVDMGPAYFYYCLSCFKGCSEYENIHCQFVFQ